MRITWVYTGVQAHVTPSTGIFLCLGCVRAIRPTGAPRRWSHPEKGPASWKQSRCHAAILALWAQCQRQGHSAEYGRPRPCSDKATVRVLLSATSGGSGSFLSQSPPSRGGVARAWAGLRTQRLREGCLCWCSMQLHMSHSNRGSEHG